MEPVAWWRSPLSLRAVDRLLAIVCFPLVALLTFAPGGLHEPGEGVGSGPVVSGLLFRLVPGLLVEGSHSPVMAVDHWPVALGVFVLVPGAVSLAVLYRRSRPEWLLGTGVALLALITNIVPTALALYSYAAWNTDRRKLAVWTMAALAAFTVGLWGTPPSWSVLTMALVTFVTPLSLGLWKSTRKRLLESLRDRAERLEHEQQLMAERAVTAERTRIAREMHDVVAHRVSLIVLHAGGIELSAEDEELARSAEQISGIGREALSELREVLGVLYGGAESPVPMAPQPILADLDRLVEQWRTAGMNVRLETTGTPSGPQPRLERTVYRIVQEALTNAGKHASGGPVRVHVRHRRTDVLVTVVNELVDSPTRAPLPESGYGLAGLRERVALAGGELVVGPLPDGVWELRATLPLATAPPVPDNGTEEGLPERSRTETKE